MLNTLSVFYICLQPLVDLNRTKYLAIEPEASLEPDGPSQQKERKRYQPHVSEVQDGASHVRDLKFCEEVHERVHVQVQACRARGKERAPPPCVVFAAQLKVA